MIWFKNKCPFNNLKNNFYLLKKIGYGFIIIK